MKAKRPGWKEQAQQAKVEMRPPISTKSSKRSLVDDERGSVASNSAFTSAAPCGKTLITQVQVGVRGVKHRFIALHPSACKCPIMHLTG